MFIELFICCNDSIFLFSELFDAKFELFDGKLMIFIAILWVLQLLGEVCEGGVESDECFCVLLFFLIKE